MSFIRILSSKNFQLNRRNFIGGAGTAIGLPLLEAMLPSGRSAFASAQLPTRLLAYYVPCGMHMQSWTPEETGSNYTMSTSLLPLKDFKDDFLVVSGLANRPATPDGAGDHASGTGSFLTATKVRKTKGDDILNGISVDQVAASILRDYTKLPSLELGIDGGGSAGGCDSGYSCAYSRNISWSGPRTPMPKIVDPRLVFDRIFSGNDSDRATAESAERRALNKSVLDSVIIDVKKLQKRLGATDKAKLDEYLTSISQLEKKIAEPLSLSCKIPERPTEYNSFENHVEIMSDLMTIAFQCDVTRVISFMLGNAASSRSYEFLGINQGHHEISHHQNLQSNFDKLEKINSWETTQFANLLERLKTTTDITGTSLLDSCSIFFSSEISDGNSHSHDNLPVLLAGKANGYFKTGRHIRYEKETPIANLFLTMLDSVQIPLTQFGDDGRSLLRELSTLN